MTDQTEKGREGQSFGAPASDGAAPRNAAPQTAAGTGSDRPAASFGDLQQKASQDFSEIKDAAKAQASQALDKTAEMAAEKKNIVADQLAGVAEALEKVGGELGEGEHAFVGRYARDLGGSARRIAADLKNRDMGEVMSMAEDFGRRQPVAFLGLAALAGLATSRFVTASARRQTTQASHAENRNASPASASRNAAGTGAAAQRPAPQASHSTTGQSGLGNAGQSASAASRPAATPATNPASRPVQAGQDQSSRPAAGAEGTGIGGSVLGTSPDRPASASGSAGFQSGRVSIGGSGAARDEAGTGAPGNTYNATSNTSSEGRPHVQPR